MHSLIFRTVLCKECLYISPVCNTSPHILGLATCLALIQTTPNLLLNPSDPESLGAINYSPLCYHLQNCFTSLLPVNINWFILRIIHLKDRKYQKMVIAFIFDFRN